MDENEKEKVTEQKDKEKDKEEEKKIEKEVGSAKTLMDSVNVANADSKVEDVPQHAHTPGATVTNGQASSVNSPRAKATASSSAYW